MRIKVKILFLFLVVMSLRGFAQTDTEFWFAVPKVTEGHGWGNQNTNPLQKFYFRFANMERLNSIIIDMPANADFEPITYNNFQPYQAITIDVTDIIKEIWIEKPWDGVNDETLYNRGIRIRSQYNMTAYYEVGVPNNPDIFSLKGENALGTNFYVPFQNRNSNGNYNPQPYSAIYIVATEDNTKVTVTPTRPVFPDRPAKESFDLMLNRGESVAIAPDHYTSNVSPHGGQRPENHLGGSRVQSDKPIAITTSDDSVIEGSCKDLIGDQIIPTSVIGTEYIAMRGQLHDNREYFYVVGTESDTRVYVNGNLEVTLEPGEMYRHQMTKTQKRYHIYTTNPSYVYHVAGFGCEAGGAVLPPVNVCTGSFRVAFTRSKAESFFLNILVRTGAEDGFTLNVNYLDNNNEQQEATWNLSDYMTFHPVPGTGDWLAGEIRINNTLPNGDGDLFIPTNGASHVVNTKDVFHLAVINGGTNTGTMYGYFSNFNELEVDAGIGIIGDDILFGCHGDSFNLVASDGISHYWSPPTYLDDPTSQNPIATPEESIAYTVVVTGACKVTASATVSIRLVEPVISLFTIEEALGCAPFDVNIVNESQGAQFYIWDFGDGNINYTQDKTFSYSYQNTEDEPREYNIGLKAVTGYCADVMETTVNVLPEIRTEIVVDEDLIGNEGKISACAPLEISFGQNSLNAHSLYWDFGDGNTSVEANPIHVFENNTHEPITYTVMLKARSEYGTDEACEAYDEIQIEVRPFIQAGFDFDPPVHCNPYPVEITNTSKGATRSYWDFISETDTLINNKTFTYTLNNPGEEIDHTIRLFVENDFGCHDEMIRDVVVYPLLVADFEPSDLLSCEPGIISFINNSQGAESWHWDFDGAGSSSEKNPQDIEFTNNSSDEDKVYHVKLTAISQYGCKEFMTVPITIASRLKAGFTIEDDNLCSPHGDAVLQFKNHSTGASKVEWIITNDADDEEIRFEESQTDFTYTFNNTTSKAVEYTITQRVENIHNCSEEVSRSITVYPRVKAVIETVESGCHPLNVAFDHNSVNAAFFRWEFNDGSSYFSSTVQKEFFNTSYTEKREIEVKLFVESEYGCMHDTLFKFEVYPRPLADFVIPEPQGCAPLPVDFVDNSVVSGQEKYHWTFGNQHEESRLPGSTAFIFKNAADVSLDEEITLEVTNEFGCSHKVARDILVYPNIEASFDVSAMEGCHPLDITIINNSTGASAAVPYQWNYGNGTSSETASEHYRTFTNFDTDSPVDYTINLVAESYYGCKDIVSQDITVFPKPRANFHAENHTGCSPLDVIFEDLSQGTNLQYEWIFKEGTFSGQAATSNYTYTVPAEEELTHFYPQLNITNDWGCEDVHSALITVYPETKAVFVSDVQDGCHPLQVAFESQSIGAQDYQWNFGDGKQSNHTVAHNEFFNNSHFNLQEYTVSLDVVSAYGCEDRVESVISVFPVPRAHYHVDEPTACSPHTPVFEDFSQGSGLKYLWTFKDGHTDNTPGNVAFEYVRAYDLDPGVFISSLEVTNSFGCKHQYEKNITIYPDIEASFVVSETNGCHPLTVNLQNTSLGATGSQPNLWDYGNGKSAENAENHERVFHNFSHTHIKEYEIGLLVESAFGCHDFVAHNIVVNPVPHANYDVKEHTACSPHTAIFEDVSVGNDLQYQWSFDDGNVTSDAGTVKHTYVQPYDAEPGIFVSGLQLTNNFGCTSRHEKIITVYPDIEARFTAAMEGCHPLSVQFSNHSLGADKYHWDFGDGNFTNKRETTNTFFNDSHTQIKEFPVILDVTSNYGCQAQFDDKVTVFPKPKVNFVMDEISGCSPFTLTIENTSQGVGKYSWQLGDESSAISDNAIERIFVNKEHEPDTLPISLYGTNQWACDNSIEKQIVVFPEVTALFSSASENYEGCTPFALDFENHSMLAEKYIWYFGDEATATSKNAAHVFHNYQEKNTFYDVGLQAISAYGCDDFIQKQITVFQHPVADFDASPHRQNYPNRTIYVNNYSSAGNWNYQWDMGDGNTFSTQSREPFEHTYAWTRGDYAGREFEINLRVSSEQCSHQMSQKVRILSPYPVVGFWPSAQGCPPFEVQFSNETLYGESFHWDFADGHESTDEHPKHVFEHPGTYRVRLRVTGEGGVDSTFQTITVFEPPVAEFRLENPIVQIPLDEAHFVNLSTNAITFFWEFGDGHTSEEIHPSHYYVEKGNYDITLTVASHTDPQCFHSITKESVVKVEDNPCQLLFPNAFNPNSGGASGGRYLPNDPSSHVFHPVYEGIEEYNLWIYNRWGELLFESKDISVGWDGYYRGELAPMGVYVYRVKAKCLTGREIDQIGDITLLR